MRDDLRSIFEAGVAAANPSTAVLSSVRLQGRVLHAAGVAFDLSRARRVLLTAVGKGAAPMAMALMDLLGERIDDALVVVKKGHGAALPMGRLMEAAHPVPDESGLRASQAVLDMAGSASEGDLFLLALTGGASALLPAPAEGLELEDLRRTTRLLLESGADIASINAVRSHLSRIGGGGLALAAHPADMLGLLVSDVVGDDVSVIGSGPLAANAATFDDCLEVLRSYKLIDTAPGRVLDRLRRGAAGEVPETPKPGDPVFGRVHQEVVSSNVVALDAAAARARKLGYSPMVLSSRITGEAREAARFFTSVALETARTRRPLAPPACLLMGGETTVHVRGRGLGGRNQEMALASALELDGAPSVAVLCAGTDGSDGPTDAAGAFAFGDTVERAKAMGLEPEAFLAENDSYHFFDHLGDLLRTGPTRTNVMDMAIALAAKPVEGEAP